jgi:hypothetical protein
VANGGTGATDAVAALTNLGAYPASNPAGYTSNVGTVTSVSGTGTVSGLSLSGTVTSAGSLTLGGTLAVLPSNFASQTANTVLAAPNGSAGVPTFRNLVAADVPTLNQNTTGTASNVTGIVAVANGGTGASVAGTARTNLGAAASGANTDITSIALTTGTISTSPTSGTDIVNKDYADSIASGINFHQSVRLATTAALSAYTYNNGTSGVGATITANANGALSVDGVAAVAGNRVLIKNESGAAEAYNGVYTVTQVGNGSTPYILTRATDFDSSGSGVDQIDAGDFFLVTAGSTLANTSWVQQTPLPITVGTTAIVFTQFGAPITYSAGTGLSLTGTTFSITNTGVSASTYGSASSVPVIAVNAQGQITSASASSIAIAASQITSGALAIANGGTGATSAATALTNLGAYPASNPSGFTSNTGTVTSVNLTAGTGVSVSGGPITASGSITVTNTAPDQVVSLTGSGATTVTGTYPNFTISSPTSGAGTVTSIDVSGGTTGLTTSGGPVTSSGTITLAGTLNVANGGTGATTLSSGYVLKGNGTSAVSASVIYDTGTNVGIGTTSPNSKFDVRGTINASDGTNGNVRAYVDATSAYLQSLNQAANAYQPLLIMGSTVAFANNGTTRMTLDTFGTLGLGTTTGGGKLNIKEGSTNFEVNTSGVSADLLAYDRGASAYKQLKFRGSFFTFDPGDVEKIRIDTVGNLGLNTTTPVGRLSVVSGSSTGAATSAWSGNYSVFGPNAGGATGAAIALGYNTSADAAEILALAPAVAWKPLNLYSAGLNLYASSGGIGASLNGSGTFSAATDVRAPVFYDSADTAFYVDPASGSRLGGVVQFNGGSKVEGNGDVYARRSGGTDGVYYFVDGGSKYLYWDGGQYLFGNAGVVTSTSFRSSTDTRAPIFYDSDNTSYYLDPASGSNLNGTLVNSGGTAMTAGWNRNMMLAATFPVLVFNSANVKYSGIGVDYTSAPAGMYFWVNGSSADVTGTGTIAMNINTGNFVTANDFRAPIFRDSDNTAYYGDFAGTSSLNSLIVGTNGSGLAYDAAAIGKLYFGSAGGDASTNYHITTNMENVGGNYSKLDFKWYTGQRFYAHYAYGGFRFKEITTGNTLFSVGESDLNVRVANAIYSPIYYDGNNSAYYGDFASTSVLFGLTITGTGNKYLQIQSTDSGEAMVRYLGATGPSWYVGKRTSTSLVDTASFHFYSESAGATVAGIDVSGNMLASGSMRAPIFYDNNNTGYYVDPASTSRMNNLSLDTVAITSGITGLTSAPITTQYANAGSTNTWYPMTYQRAQYSGGYVTHLNTGLYKSVTDWGSGVTGWYAAIGGNDSYPTQAWYLTYDGFIQNSLGYVSTGISFRAPVFYDSQNTNYYVDPVSGFYLGGAGGTTYQSTGSGLFVVNAEGTGSTVRLGAAWSRAGTYSNGSYTLGSESSIHFWISNSEKGYIDSSSNLFMNGSVRAPIFYDSDNTAYYVDPAGGSNLQSIYTDTVNSGVVGDPLELCYSRGNEVRIGPSGGNLPIIAGEYTRPAAGVGYLSGRYGSVEGNGTTGPIYCISTGYAPTSTTLGSMYGIGYTDGATSGVYGGAGWGMYVAAAGVARVFLDGSNGNAFFNSSARAPIFYDSNNTGYYFDGSATSRWTTSNQDGYHTFNNYGLGIVGLYASTRFQCVYAMGDAYKGNADGTSLSGAYGLWWSYPSAGGPAATLSSHGLMCIVNGSNVAQLDASTRANGDMRAPIFYDLNNTGYYTDPAGTSALSTVTFGSSPNGGGGGGRITPSTGSPYSLRQEFGSDNSGWRYGIAKNVSGTVTIMFYVQDNGDCVATGNVTAYSDVRLKANIETIPSALDKLDQIRGVTYTRTDMDDKERRYAGVIAQEIEAVLPEAVGGDEDIKTVDYNATIALLIQAVKELRDEVEALRK